MHTGGYTRGYVSTIRLPSIFIQTPPNENVRLTVITLVVVGGAAVATNAYGGEQVALECAAEIELAVARDEQATTNEEKQVALECAAEIGVSIARVEQAAINMSQMKGGRWHWSVLQRLRW